MKTDYPLLLILSRIPLRRFFVWILVITPCITAGQSVSEIITDFGGYWKSSSSQINAVKPDNSHNLLSFFYNGIRYSTGVKDSLLTAHGETFVAGDYKALPVSQLTGAVTANTKIGLGAMYDGVLNGASTPKPENNMVKYLTDGVKGLDLGTCVANLPAGDLFFPINNIQSQLIGDNIPDLIISQIADPSSSSLDRYEFTDINGNRVGNTVDIVLSNLAVSGNWTADFYEASSNPLTLQTGFTRTDRPIRLWAADFNTFGINSSNIQQIAYFKIRLNGNSDVAFVAYNNQSFEIVGTPLPARYAYFHGKAGLQQVTLNWQTVTEINTDRFVVEASYDGVIYSSLDSIKASGISTVPHNYSYTHHNPKPGKIYYRLKQVDINGLFIYSSIVTVAYNSSTAVTVAVYPNPTTDGVYINYPGATGNVWCQVLNMQGMIVLQKNASAGSVQCYFDMQQLAQGTYLVVWKHGNEKQVKPIVKQ